MTKIELQTRRAELVAELGTNPSPTRLVEVQAALREVNAELKRLNTIANANAKAEADRRRSLGLAEQAANLARARGNRTDGVSAGTIAVASSCRDNGSGVCTSCSTVHPMSASSVALVNPKDPNGPPPRPRPQTLGEACMASAKILLRNIQKIPHPEPHTVEFHTALTIYIEEQRAHIRRVRAEAEAKPKPENRQAEIDAAIKRQDEHAWKETWGK